MESTSAGDDVGSHAGTLDLTGGGPDHIEANHTTPDSSRHYGGPMAHQLKSRIFGWIVVIVLFAVAIAMSAISLQQSNEALELANANVKVIEEASVFVVPSPSTNDGVAVPVESPPESPAAPTPPAPTPVVPVATPNPTTPKPTPTEAPTDPHPLNPEWFQTTHADWQFLNESRYDNPAADIHSHSTAFMMCYRQEKALCTYDVYCPNGKGSAPFHGGPPKVHNWESLEKTQWAPYGTAGPDTAHSMWVQIGTLEGTGVGSEENDFGKCWKYGDFYAGNGVDVEDAWGEEHRMWMLCCDKVEEDP